MVSIWPGGRPAPAGGRDLVGRLVPEKGADLAILAAREAGLALDLVGPSSTARYFERSARSESARASAISATSVMMSWPCGWPASASLVTPRWSEPYGLVAAESLACGTPVAGFACGALPELVDPTAACWSTPDDVGALAAPHCAPGAAADHARARARGTAPRPHDRRLRGPVPAARRPRAA